MAADTATIHASAVLIGPKAALIRGPAGSGKSRLVWDLPGTARQDEIEGEAGLAGAGGAADQHGLLADLDRGGVNAWAAVAHSAGSLTTKRAPATVGAPSASSGPARFSAQMRPPWASTICFEIDRPRPEFWPKP